MGYQEVFGGTNIYPADATYIAVTLTGPVDLDWPMESAAPPYPLARIIDVIASGPHAMRLPDATEGSPGAIILFNNLTASSSDCFVTDFDGNIIATLGVGEQWEIYLTDNTTSAGAWEVFRFGASTATVQPSALAGYGLTVTGSTLSQSVPVTTFAASPRTVLDSDRASAMVWTGAGSGVLNLPGVAAVGNNFFVSARNAGGGMLTLDPLGTEQIDGSSSVSLAPGEGVVLVTDGLVWYTLGRGQAAVFAFDFTTIAVGPGPTYTLTGAELNRIAYRFTGVLATNTTVIVPSTVQQYWIDNSTTGPFTLSLSTLAGVPVVVPQGSRGIYYCNGSNVVDADTGGISVPISAAQGGTGQTSYAIGDLLAASAVNVLSRLAAVPVGNALISQGVGVMPIWGKINLVTMVSGLTPGSVIFAGAGGAVAEDNANFFWDDTQNSLGIGSAPATGTSLHIVKDITGNTNGRVVSIIGTIQPDVLTTASGFRTSLTTAAAVFTLPNLFHFRAEQAVLGAGSVVSVQSGFFATQSLNGAVQNIGFRSADTSALILAGKTQFGFYAENNVATAGGTTWNFYAAGDAPNFLSGRLGIGVSPLVGAPAKLTVGGVTSGGPSYYGVLCAQPVQAAVTSEYISFVSSSNTQAAAFNLTNMAHFRAQQGVFGAGSTVTNQIGFWVNAGLVSGANNYGFYGEVPSGTGRWNFYAAGTADNYMAGSLGLGASGGLGNIKLRLSGVRTGSGNQYMVYSDPTLASDVTGLVAAFNSNIATQAAAFNVSSLRHYLANGASLGAGSSITDQHGFLVEGSMTTATNNYGFFGNIPAGAGRWNLYMAGTADNFMQGALGIGQLPPATNSLRVGKNITGGATAQGVSSDGIIQSDVLTNAHMYLSQPSTVAAAFTLGTLSHYRATQISLGAGSAVTAQNGFVAGQMTAATINVGFLANNSASVGPGKTSTGFQCNMEAAGSGGTAWAYLSVGSAPSAHAGALRIGSLAAPTVALDVTGAIAASTTVKTGVYTVATLPSAAASGAGARAYVSNSTTNVFDAAVAGGGVNQIPVTSDGATWKAG